MTEKFNNDHKLNQVTFNGKSTEGQFNFHLWDKHRETTSIKMKFYSVSSADYFYSSSTSGLIGIKPYTAGNKETNFMYQLKQQGLIKFSTVSFYLNDQQGNNSYVKFGGYD